jgi:hypothetical protein
MQERIERLTVCPLPAAFVLTAPEVEDSEERHTPVIPRLDEEAFVAPATRIEAALMRVELAQDPRQCVRQAEVVRRADDDLRRELPRSRSFRDTTSKLWSSAASRSRSLRVAAERFAKRSRGASRALRRISPSHCVRARCSSWRAAVSPTRWATLPWPGRSPCARCRCRTPTVIPSRPSVALCVVQQVEKERRRFLPRTCPVMVTSHHEKRPP